MRKGSNGTKSVGEITTVTDLETHFVVLELCLPHPSPPAPAQSHAMLWAGCPTPTSQLGTSVVAWNSGRNPETSTQIEMGSVLEIHDA